MLVELTSAEVYWHKGNYCDQDRSCKYQLKDSSDMSSLSHLILKMACFGFVSSPVGNKKWQGINSDARVADCINDL